MEVRYYFKQKISDVRQKHDGQTIGVKQKISDVRQKHDGQTIGVESMIWASAGFDGWRTDSMDG